MNPLNTLQKISGEFMTIEEKLYIERTEEREEEHVRLEKRLRELGVSEEIIKAAMSDQSFDE